MYEANIATGPEIAVPTGIDDLAIDLVLLPANLERKRLGLIDDMGRGEDPFRRDERARGMKSRGVVPMNRPTLS